MQDILLIAAVAAVFAFGWYLMGKLDAFLESNRQDQIALLSASENILQIGFFDPLVADSLSGVLEKYSKIHPSVSASLFSGTETELMREFSLHKLDMIFLPENASVPEKIRGQVDEVSLEHMPQSGTAASRFDKSPDGAVRSTCGKNLHGFHKH